MYGAWEVGVWKALSRWFQPDLVVGASAGAWVGWAIAGGCTIDELIGAWLDPETGLIMRPGLHRSGLIRPETLHRKARELFARWKPKIPYGLTVVEMPWLRPRVVRGSEVRWEHLAATASIPLCFPPVRIDGRLYVDGGLMGALPLWAAEELGATRAIAVNALTAAPFRALRRLLPPRRTKPEFEILPIEPSEPLGTLRDAIRWSPANIERWIKLGERDASRISSSATM
jgi:NTE family protein